MKQRLFTIIFVIALTLIPFTAQANAGNENACWGQATAVFAHTGVMGEHASQEPTPRMGLHNLAVALYDAGIIEDDSMAALGAFVASALGLSIDACGS
ncbi:MAG: hypothetical protein R2911_36495 [Caldilineaceae bacterium]